MKITVLYNLPGSSTAHVEESDEDTQKCAHEVADGLKANKYEVDMLGIGINDIAKIEDIKADVVFNLVEWSGRECEHGVKAIEELERVGLRYTGSTPWGYRLSCDKMMMKAKMQEENIPTPLWQIFETGDETITLPYPLIVKPTLEHCAIGVSQTSVCVNEQDARAKIRELLSLYKQPVLGEEFIEGLEAHVTVLQRNGQPWVLPPAVIQFEEKPGFKHVLTYESKWKDDSWETKLSKWRVEKLPDEVVERIKTIAQKTNEKLGGRSYARMDMRIRGKEVFVLEINNNPGIGIDPDSGITYSVKEAGLTWEGLLRNIVEEAMR